MMFLDDCASVQGPLRSRHMRFLRLALRVVSGWPGRELSEPTLRFEYLLAYYNTSLASLFLLLGLSYLYVHLSHLTFFEAGHMYLVLLINGLSLSRGFTLILNQKYRGVVQYFVRHIHLFHYKHKSQFAQQVYVTVHKWSHMFAVFVSSSLFLAVLLFILTPLYNNYAAGKFRNVREDLVNTTFEHPVYLLMPWNTETNFRGYVIVTIINWYGSCLAGTSICMFDLLLSIMIFNLWGHFKILLHNLENFPTPKDGGTDLRYSVEELQLMSARLKECMQHHRLIIEFIGSMSDVFGKALLVYYVFHQVTGCIMLLEVSQMSPQALARYVPLTCVMFQQLIQMSVIFETVNTMSGRLKDAVYGVPWELMDVATRRSTLVFLANVQEPIQMKAGAMIGVGVTTMATILRDDDPPDQGQPWRRHPGHPGRHGPRGPRVRGLWYPHRRRVHHILHPYVVRMLEFYGFKVTVRMMIVYLFIPELIINLVRDLKLLTPVSIVSNVLMTLGLLLVFFYLIDSNPEITDDMFKIKEWGNIPLFVGVTLFALEAVGVVLALEYNMEKPEQFTGLCGLFSIGMCLILALFIVVGVFGYVMPGTHLA